jgi:hypothetical protein
MSHGELHELMADHQKWPSVSSACCVADFVEPNSRQLELRRAELASASINGERIGRQSGADGEVEAPARPAAVIH